MMSSTFHQIQNIFLNWNVLYAVLFEKQMYNSGNFNGKNRWIIKKVTVVKKLLPHLATRGTYPPRDWRCDEAWREQTLVYPPVMCQQRLIYCTWELSVMYLINGSLPFLYFRGYLISGGETVMFYWVYVYYLIMCYYRWDICSFYAFWGFTYKACFFIAQVWPTKIPNIRGIKLSLRAAMCGSNLTASTTITIPSYGMYTACPKDLVILMHGQRLLWVLVESFWGTRRNINLPWITNHSARKGLNRF